jgi:hypothetical protein
MVCIRLSSLHKPTYYKCYIAFLILILVLLNHKFSEILNNTFLEPSVNQGNSFRIALITWYHTIIICEFLNTSYFHSLQSLWLWDWVCYRNISLIQLSYLKVVWFVKYHNLWERQGLWHLLFHPFEFLLIFEFIELFLPRWVYP